MKRIHLILILLPLLISSGFTKSVYALAKQDSVTVLNPSLNLLYECISSDTVKLTANLSVRKEDGIVVLENAKIQFKAYSGSKEMSLGNVTTDPDGNAVTLISAKPGLPTDRDGKTTYSASFTGTSKYAPASSSVTAKRAKINVTFSQQDSVRNIHLKALQVEWNGEEKPLSKQTVNVYIPRLFSLLKIGEAELDANGEAFVEFPQKLVGDSLGNLLIIAKIEENDLFGTVKGEASVTWGIPKQYYTAEKPSRELWTPVAPIWMIITLIIMLTGVWAHYLYAVFQMIMIKRHSMQKKEYL
jgi:hypothetical protein